MTKHYVGWVAAQKRWLLAFLVMLSASTVIAFFIRSTFDTCDLNGLDVVDKRVSLGEPIGTNLSPLNFMKSKIVLLVSHLL
ncbi:hypothetical protein C1H46_023096 [Malus baccata]|uniref:Uncharacterized protein n=1 Tax=Malus baccata TaxID=106549 RepID=A0A540LXW7_MALBA|nr:hypothetical protein C1H46_023096 [Malus baccata]